MIVPERPMTGVIAMVHSPWRRGEIPSSEVVITMAPGNPGEVSEWWDHTSETGEVVIMRADKIKVGRHER